MKKDKLLVSFSGGETSAYMLWWVLNNWQDKYEIKVVFANTGEENEETLVFVDRCSKYFNIEVVWIEGVFHKEKMKGTTHKIVNFETATRSNKLFEEMIQVYGIPNKSYPHCNRELKLQPIKSYLRSIGWKDYYTAIGIRHDEIDRVSSKRKKERLVYPLIEEVKMTKPKVNFFWSQQPFRLNLKGFEGNCKTCWKKSDKKLQKIAYDDPNKFNSFKILEKEYSNFIPESRSLEGKSDDYKITFFRENKSAKWYIENAADYAVYDDSKDLNVQSDLFEDDESCDIFSMCGED
jgi:hypothetical protein